MDYTQADEVYLLSWPYHIMGTHRKEKNQKHKKSLKTLIKIKYNTKHLEVYLDIGAASGADQGVVAKGREEFKRLKKSA